MLEDIQDLQRELRNLQEQIESKTPAGSLTAQRVALAQGFEAIHKALSSHEDYSKEQSGRNDQAMGATIEILGHTLDKLLLVSQRFDAIVGRLAKLESRVEKMESNVAWMG